MAAVKIDKFGGIAPCVHPTLLADGMAERAHNCRLKTGKLVPLRQPGTLANNVKIMGRAGLQFVQDAKSMHIWRRNDGSFDLLLFPGVTWTERGNVANDVLTRLIVSGATGVSYTAADGVITDDTPVVYMRKDNAVKVVPLAKEPLPAPRVRRVSTGEMPEARMYTRFFVTWVDAYGMESPASPPSVMFEQYMVDDGWTITPGADGSYTISKEGEATVYVAASEVGGVVKDTSTDEVVGVYVLRDGELEYVDGDIVELRAIGTGVWPVDAEAIRIYKVVTGSETDNVQFIKEFSRAAAGDGANDLTFAISDKDAGEAMPEMEAPPYDLINIQAVPGGFYCGFSPSQPKTVMFSDVNLLYSWPMAYRYDVSDNLVALAVAGNTVYALTDGDPYAISGTAPESMTVTKLAGPAACSSPRSVCVYRNSAYFVSEAGLMVVGAASGDGLACTCLTNDIFTKEQWQAFNPESCMMGQFDGALHLFFKARYGESFADGTKHAGLVIDLTALPQIAVTTHDEVAQCLCVDGKFDRLYFIRAS